MSLQLPNVKKLGKSVSHWEIMDKIRCLIKPDEFTVLKVTKTTVEFVRFEGEIETREKLERVISKVDNKMIKLKDFSDLMRIRAAEWRSDYPNRRVWDDFFSNARDMDEMKPGERPDTIHISHLPSKWLVPYHLSDEEDVTPSEKIFYKIFEKFGSIRFVDIPICDPYRKKMKENISGLQNSSFDKTEFFEGYVQFKDYIGFVKAMDAFRNMKLVRKEDDGAVEVNIKVDFDKSKHLSDASIRRREIVRDRLVKKNREKEEKEQAELEEKKRMEELERQKEVDIKEQKKLRRKLREEKRKAKILEKLEITGSDEINEKIAKEEKKLLKVQRKLEAIRLVEELFRRIKEKKSDNMQLYDNISNPSYDELKRYKNASELEVLTQREKLHNILKGRVMLKSILSDGKRPRKYSSSSSNSDFSIEDEDIRQRPKTPVMEKYPELFYDPSWVEFQYPLPPGPMYAMNPFASMRGLQPRGRPFPRFPGIPGPSRGGFNRRRGNFQPRFRGGYRAPNPRQYPQDTDEEYQKYLTKFLYEHDERIYVDRRRSYSPHRFSRRSRSRSDSRRRSYSPSRSRSHSRNRSRSGRSRSRSYRSRSRRSKSRSYSRERSRKSRSRERSRSRSKSNRNRRKNSHRSRSKSQSERKSRRTNSSSKEKSPKSRSQTGSVSSRSQKKSQKNSKDKDRSRSRDKSRSREKSVDSSTFLTPKQLSEQRSAARDRSKSWSLPKEGEKGRSWSKSPERK
ncbi:A-kinase anchor protein 17A isoform X2 [Leptinotarsa decemlineata]